MTSNIGSHIIQEELQGLNENNRDAVFDETRRKVFEVLRQTLRPEFLNRVDELIMFTPLSKDEIKQIVKLQVEMVQKMIGKEEINLQVTEKAHDYLADIGFDPQYGARPIKRVLQRNILNELSRQIIAGKVNKEQPIVVDFNGKDLLFNN
jgi:ATP-dependent Clp protease ATP-binding subunit ClpB